MMLRKTGKGLFGLSPAQSKTLWKSLCGMSSRHFRGARKMNEQLNALLVLFHGPAFPLRPTSMASEVLAFLLEVLRCEALQGAAKSPGKKLDAVYRYIQEHLEESFSVPDLARQAGLSTPRFKARFKEEAGVPPAEYVLRARIEKARKRLASGSGSVTQVAYGLGFSSSQYFATVFKRFTGKTPSVEKLLRSQ
jgi:AraC-like DNA-binding protein